MADDDKLLVVPLGSESKNITQIISNDTARSILELLAESPMSTSAIAKKLDIPLTTAQYNVEKLIEAGLVKIERTKYSEKGREVKLYSAAKRYIVLVPEKTPSQAVIDAIKKYLVLLPIAAVLSIIVEYFVPLKDQLMDSGEEMLAAGADPNRLSYAPDIGIKAAPVPAPETVTSSITDQISQSLSYADPLHHSGVLFLTGCLIIISMVVVLEYLKYRKK
ncbi:ArsR family transcriptional regulator [Methanocella sp. CWC-04]|uniref:ArsR family transcriptional regulator n=1 Tax=Methanooceanicella nereidis TaxID=2052831 RepID=A0AAP2RDI3_9EURY|nr:helix-turn-helix domain-containing protein [Methanocella sp. CWC-04]MCD1294605.1 ArsR family transcriptional regulator [Methanocella sp. CWC-04]